MKHVPVAVLRGLSVAVELAGADIDVAREDFSRQAIHDFDAAYRWLVQQKRSASERGLNVNAPMWKRAAPR